MGKRTTRAQWTLDSLRGIVRHTGRSLHDNPGGATSWAGALSVWFDKWRLVSGTKRNWGLQRMREIVGQARQIALQVAHVHAAAVFFADEVTHL